MCQVKTTWLLAVALLLSPVCPADTPTGASYETVTHTVAQTAQDVSSVELSRMHMSLTPNRVEIAMIQP